MQVDQQLSELPSPYPGERVHPPQLPGYSMTYPPPMMAGEPNDIGSIHTVHAILSLVTLGLWLPVWIIHAILRQRRAPRPV